MTNVVVEAPNLRPQISGDTFTIECVKSKSQLWDFIKLPWAIYKDNKNWVPPLLRDEKYTLYRNKYPFHKYADVEYFLARNKEGAFVGRIAAIVNHRYNEFHKENIGFFGFFECIDNSGAACALLKTAEDWVRAKGMTAIKGPCNFSTNETLGMLIDCFDRPPVFFMPYNKPYYPTLVEAAGYKKDIDLLAFHITSQMVTKDKFERVAGRISSNGVKIRFIDDKNFDAEMLKIKQMYNNFYMDNWGCVPMTDEEFDANIYYFKKVFVRELTYIAEVDGRAIGFAFATPDFNQIFSKLNGRLFPFGWLKLWLGKNKIRVIRMMEIGILPEYRNKGIAALFYLEFVKAAARRKDLWCELSWIPQTNAVEVRQLLKIGAKHYKTYRIYEKQL